MEDQSNYHICDFESFKQQYDFIYLKGLKGLEQACQIQDKLTNKLYDYFEIDLKVINQFDQFVKFSEKLIQINHPHILKLIKYSRVFGEEQLGEPFCKFFFIFEYSESSIHDEILHLKKSKKNFSRKRIKQIFTSLASAILFLHDSNQVHSDLRTENIFKSEQGDYKLLPSKIKPRQKDTFYFYSPEEYKFINFRQALDRSTYDKFKSEIFSFGMFILSISTFYDFNEAYGKFDIKEQIIQEGMSYFQIIFGQNLTDILQKCLNFDQSERITAKDLLQFLNSHPSEESIPQTHQTIHTQQSQNMNVNKSADSNRAAQKITGQTTKNDKNSQPRTPYKTRAPTKTADKNVNNLGFGGLQNAVMANMQNQVKAEDEQEEQDKKIFNTLPQEYQDEIDKIVSVELKRIEDNCPVEYLPMGNRYQGQKNKDNKPDGWGYFWWANGQIYSGQFVNGNYEGIGIYLWPNGVKYYGEFLGCEINGLGVRFYNNGIYFGNWKNGKNENSGTFYWTNGAKFKGNFIDDKIYGKGILYITDENGEERIYEGLWKDEDGTGIQVDKYSFESRELENKYKIENKHTNIQKDSKKNWQVTHKYKDNGMFRVQKLN